MGVTFEVPLIRRCTVAMMIAVAPGAPLAWGTQEGPAPAGTQALSLRACVAIALARNPAVRAAQHGAQAAGFRVREERAAYSPRVSLDAGAARGSTGEGRDKGLTTEDESRVRLVGELLLFDGGARGGRVAGARADEIAAASLADAAAIDVATAVALAYVERLAAESIVQVAAETVEQVARHVKLAEARLASGVAARYDVLKAKTEKADADLAFVRARGAARVAQGQLTRAMGLPITTALAIMPLPDAGTAAGPGEIGSLLAAASAQRPDLRVAQARLEARRADLRVASAGHWPTVTAGGDYGLGEAALLPGRTRWSVGVGLSLPLFEGLLTPARRGRARAEESRAADEHLLTKQQSELEVWTAHARLVEAQEARGAADVLLTSAEESARVAEGMYQNGVSSIIELVDAQAARTAARNRRVLAALDLHVASAQLGRAIGQAPVIAKVPQ